MKRGKKLSCLELEKQITSQDKLNCKNHFVKKKIEKAVGTLSK